jgi:hypothetical protein
MLPEPRIEFPTYVTQIDLQQRMTEIARAGLNQRLLLLTGAGFSKDARGYPTGAELAAILLRDTFRCTEAEAGAAAAKYELAAISQQFVEKATEKRQQLVSSVADALSKTPPKASQVELDLATVAGMCRLRRVFTTNFDNVIEQALGARARVVKPTVTDIRKFEDEAKLKDITGVFHLNGDVADPKITEDDLRTHRSVFFELLRQDMLTDLLVMVGYSFRDDAITQIYDELFELLKTVGQDRRNYIVMPTEGPLDYALSERLWRARGDIVLIPLRAEQFFHLLVAYLEEARYEQTVKGIAEQLGQTTAEVNERLRPLKDRYAHISLGEIAEAVEQFMKLRNP